MRMAVTFTLIVSATETNVTLHSMFVREKERERCGYAATPSLTEGQILQEPLGLRPIHAKPMAQSSEA